MIARDEKGTFIRTRPPWIPEKWDDGYIDNRGRFRVYCPDYPNAYEGGYAMRTHVVWWLEYGEPHPTGTNLHHKNGIKHDDRIENLEVVDHGEHTRLHKKMEAAILAVTIVCNTCLESFQVMPGRIRGRKKEGLEIKYCSQKCFQLAPKKDRRISIVCAECNISFRVIPSKSHRRFCSNSCAQLFNWRARKNV